MSTTATFLDAKSIACAARQPASIDVWETYDFTSEAEVAERIAASDVVITNKAKLDRATIEGASKLKLVIVAATGYDIIDLAACQARGITVCNSPAYSSPRCPSTRSP